MHSIITTSGFVIDSHPYGDAGKVLGIFTNQLGLVKAIAQGIRMERSKLRYFTQEYSLGDFSFVRGKEYWKLVGASEVGVSMRSKCTVDFNAKIASILNRLLHGEEPHSSLYMIVEQSIDFVCKEEMSIDEMRTFESIVVWRIMESLGYVGKDPKFPHEIKDREFSRDFILETKDKRTLLNQHINKALRESQL